MPKAILHAHLGADISLRQLSHPQPDQLARHTAHVAILPPALHCASHASKHARCTVLPQLSLHHTSPSLGRKSSLQMGHSSSMARRRTCVRVHARDVDGLIFIPSNAGAGGVLSVVEARERAREEMTDVDTREMVGEDEMPDVDTRDIAGVELADAEEEDSESSSSVSRRCVACNISCIVASISRSVSHSAALDPDAVLLVELTLGEGASDRLFLPDSDAAVLGKMPRVVSSAVAPA